LVCFVAVFVKLLLPLRQIWGISQRSSKHKINLSRVFSGQYVGSTEIAADIWLVSFMGYDLSFLDTKVNRVKPVGENPFAPKVLHLSPK
jgi:hypothetical protein